jgi:hypothetical protein
MTSSYAEKKRKTLLARKKTRKRWQDSGLTHEDASSRLFRPPSQRAPRWKKPEMEVIVHPLIATKKCKLNDIEIESNKKNMISKDKPQLRLFSSVESCVETAKAEYMALRSQDGRQKTKIIVMTESPQLCKSMAAQLNVKEVLLKSKSPRGVRSGGNKKALHVYKKIGLVTSNEVLNEEVFGDYKKGKLSGLVTHDTSFYPYMELPTQHLLYLATTPASLINFNHDILGETRLRAFLHLTTQLSDEVRAHLEIMYGFSEN